MKRSPPTQTSDIRRWSHPPIRNGNGLKSPVRLTNNYNINQQSFARTGITTQQQKSGSGTLYSVKNRVSSHVSHTVSRNYSYVKDSQVFVSNGFDVKPAVLNGTESGVVSGQPDRVSNGFPTTLSGLPPSSSSSSSSSSVPRVFIPDNQRTRPTIHYDWSTPKTHLSANDATIVEQSEYHIFDNTY